MQKLKKKPVIFSISVDTEHLWGRYLLHCNLDPKPHKANRLHYTTFSELCFSSSLSARHYMVITAFNTVTMSRYYCCSVYWITHIYLHKALILVGYISEVGSCFSRVLPEYTSTLFLVNYMNSCGDPAVELCSFCWNHGYCLYHQ